jgi:hypothetical protein
VKQGVVESVSADMDEQLVLHLSDIRLLQTLRLLEGSLTAHSDQGAVRDALHAISTARHAIAKLATPAAGLDQCCA